MSGWDWVTDEDSTSAATASFLYPEEIVVLAKWIGDVVMGG